MPGTFCENQHSRTDLAGNVARALGGARRVSSGWLARCPVHDGRDPNLSLRNGDTVPLLVKCWSHLCDPKDILKELRRRGLLDDNSHNSKPVVAETTPRPDQGKLAWLLEHLMPIEGTLVATYLDSRGLDLPADGHHLRYLPARPPKYPWPCMVSIVTDFTDAAHVLTLHLTKLKPDGTGKAPLPKDQQRSFLKGYPKKGGVIRLCDGADVTLRLGVAEGIETALAVCTAFRRTGWFQPVWSALDAGNLSELRHVHGIAELYVYADRGPAGERAARELAQRWLDAGTEVYISTAPVDDWNPAVAP
jgi:hypothetical protein